MSPENAKNILCLVTSILVLALLILHIARYRKKPKWLRMFYVWIGVLAVLGGAWAFLFPLAINADFSKDGDGAALRQMLIYTTGGVLGVITLGENHRKNSLEKAKNDQDHLRQVHAERRSRYTTAVEQLSSDKASIRLGGVYTLVGLVDEWLSDEKTTPSLEKRHKEGQVIINNLCAYIRSPLPLAERAEQLDKDYAKDLQNDFDGDIEKFDADKRAFARDKAALEEERQVRQSIIKEICERLQDFDEPGPWSSFDYDFSNAYFFYPVTFEHSHFDASVDFYKTIFSKNAAFYRVIFKKDVKFIYATFKGKAYFTETKFIGDAKFIMVDFFEDADFTRVNLPLTKHINNVTLLPLLNPGLDFSKSKFKKSAIFESAEFTRVASFRKVKFLQKAIFSHSTFSGYGCGKLYTTFEQANFTKGVDFSEAKFIEETAPFMAKIPFFSGATFSGDSNFSKATFQDEPIFEYTLDDKIYKARFSCKTDPEDYNFEASNDSPCIIETEEKEYNGVKFMIPKGAELFDPNEPSAQDNNDDS